MEEEVKKRIPLWLYPSTIGAMDALYPSNNCKSRSEYIEKAVLFYNGYLLSEKSEIYLSKMIASTLSGTVKTSENRIARLLFKIAVEMSMMMNVIAETTDMGEGYLRKLRGMCVEDVKKSNGAITFDEVTKKYFEREQSETKE